MLRQTTLVLTSLMAATPIHAATLAEWDLLGEPGNQAATAGTAAAHVSALDLTRGAGLTPSAASNSLSSAGWTGQASDYISLGFSVDAGYTVDLESLYLGSRSSSTGPGTLGLFYSGDGFAASLFTFDQTPGGNFVNSVVDLSALPDLSGTVEFRLYQLGSAAANGGATGSSGTFRVTGYFVGGTFDRNLQFTGTVTPAVVPLPAGVWLLGLGLAGLLGVARARGA